MVQPIQNISSGKKVSVEELLTLIPDDLLADLSQLLSVDKWVKKLKAQYLFKLILFSLLHSERMSLRTMEANFEDPLFRVLAPALSADEVTWTGIRERLMQVSSTFFEKLYQFVYDQAAELYGSQGLGGYHIKRYDSTMIATFSHLLEGMKVGNSGKGKRQVKLTTEFREDFLIQMQFYSDQDHLSEETALKEVIQQADSSSKDIHVFDQGLKSRKTFETFDQDQLAFITRGNNNIRYELIRPYWQDDQQQDTDRLEFIQDSVVQLYESGHNMCQYEIRLIEFRLKAEGKSIFFLTNVWDLSAAQIAQIYKSRWDIEVLFRFMKQEMNLTHFVCNDPNAIEVMLYCSMIASMLILIFKKKNNIKSFKRAKIRFFKELLYTILLEALENPEELNRLKMTCKKFLQKE